MGIIGIMGMMVAAKKSKDVAFPPDGWPHRPHRPYRPAP